MLQTFENRGLAPPVIRTADEILEAEDLLEMVNGGIIDMTVMDDYKARFWAGVFPGIVVREDLVINEGGSIAWATRKESPQLAANLANTLVETALDYYGELRAKSFSSSREFITQQLDEVRNELSNARAALTQFQIENRVRASRALLNSFLTSSNCWVKSEMN